MFKQHEHGEKFRSFEQRVEDRKCPQFRLQYLRSLAGADVSSGYRPGQDTGHGGFCTQCGVHTYAWVDAAEWNDGAYVSIGVAALDDLDPADLVAAPVQFMNGRDDDWWHAPAETRHL